MGNLTRTPEYKQFPSGQAVCKLGLATSRGGRAKGAEGSAPEVCFIDVSIWGNQAEPCKKFLDKGSLVLVEGRLRLESWTDQGGAKRNRHSIVADRVTFVKAGAQAQDGEALSNGGEDAFGKGEIDLENEEAFKEELPF